MALPDIDRVLSRADFEGFGCPGVFTIETPAGSWSFQSALDLTPGRGFGDLVPEDVEAESEGDRLMRITRESAAS